MTKPFDPLPPIKHLADAIADGTDLRRSAYSAAWAPGAWPNGSRIRKSMQEKGDPHPVGAMGTVVGSVGPLPREEGFPGYLVGTYGYFIRWDDMPTGVVFVAGIKLALAER